MRRILLEVMLFMFIRWKPYSARTMAKELDVIEVKKCRFFIHDVKTTFSSIHITYIAIHWAIMKSEVNSNAHEHATLCYVKKLII